MKNIINKEEEGIIKISGENKKWKNWCGFW